jgi:hypothetical protein
VSVGSHPRQAALLAKLRIIGLVVVLVGLDGRALAQTRELLDAPQVRSRIRVQWDRSANVLLFAPDDEEGFRPLPTKGLFLTKHPVQLSYPRINPLRMQVRVTLGDAPDPGRGALVGPLRAIMSMALIATPARPPPGDEVAFSGSASAASSSCAAESIANSDVRRLARALYGGGAAPGTVAQALDGWRRTIDLAYASGRSGPEAIGAALDQIARFGSDLDGGLDTAATLIRKADAEAARSAPADGCEAAAMYVYEGLRLADPRARLQQLVALQRAVAELHRSLHEQFLQDADSSWAGSDYKLGPALLPASGNSQSVVVRTVSLDLTLDESTGALLSAEENAGSTTLAVRKLSRLAREFGVGTVIGSLTRSRYGTSQSASGQTVVSRIEGAPVSVHPALLLNLVCLCNTGPFAAPMLQVGLTTSSDVLALLSGAGVRLFAAGRGDVAIGGGLMMGRVKDLRTLRENDPVGGTKDIEADFVARRRIGWYAVIQYKF